MRLRVGVVLDVLVNEKDVVVVLDVVEEGELQIGGKLSP